MRQRLGVEHIRALSRFAAIVLTGALAAGCSSDTTRFAGSPFSNPFASKGQDAEPRATASVPSAPRTAIRSQPLPAPLPQSASPAPAYSRPYEAPKSAASSAPPTRFVPVTQSGPGGWTAQGGTAVTIGAGENVNVIANRYGVPVSAIVSANGLSSAAQAAPGRQVIIPVYNASGSQSAALQPASQGQGKLRFVDTSKTAAMKQAEAPKQHIRPGQALAKAEPLSSRQVQPIKTAKAEVQPVAQPKVSAPAPQPMAPVAKQEPVQPVKEPEQTASLPAGGTADFRWPARGRVISGFGGSGGNEGINIAVPEGTPVKAAESGTVAYAGSEVKGYGNLVLIRHDNGFVSAYAHNGEISVKRGDKVKRGQVVAKSGQSGNVTSPQLHFEIRKGSTPVDPVPHLGGN